MYKKTQVYTSPQRRERKQVGKKESTPCKNKLEKNLILIDFLGWGWMEQPRSSDGHVSI